MPAARFGTSAFCAGLLGASRGVNRGELIGEGSTVLCGGLLDTANGTQRSNGSTEECDAGEEEESLLFGGGRHAQG